MIIKRLIGLSGVKTPSQSKMTTWGRIRELRGMSIQLNLYLRIIGIITDDCKKPLKSSVQAIGLQLNQYFSLAAGRDVRVKPYHFGASGILNLGNIKQ